MLKYLTKYKLYFVIIGIVIFVEPILASALNLYFEEILNYVSPGADFIFIVRMMLIAFLCWVSRRVITFISSVINSRYMDSIRKDIKNDTFKNLLKMNVAELEGISDSGEYASIFINDVNMLEQRYFSNIISFIASVVAVIINAAALLYMNYMLAIPIGIFALLIAFIPLIFYKKLSKSQFEFSKQIGNFTQTIKEFVGSYPTIKNYAVEDPVLDRFKERNLTTENSKFISEYHLVLSSSVSSLLSWFMQIIAVGVGFTFVIKGQILLGTVIAARGFANDIAEPLNNMVTSFNSILSIKKVTKKIKIMTGENTKNVDYPSLEKKTNVSFSNVTLMIDNKAIIQDFSFNFEYGKKYLIIGRNGSGKSTLFRLLKKRYPAYSGKIKIGNVSIADTSTKEIAKSVSYLNEKVDLFSGTVKENIVLFSSYDEEELKKAIEKTKLSVDLERNVNDSGFNVSSGEKRRIEIARSLLHGSDMIVFDEVVSTLDALTAYEIEEMVLGYDNTVVFISHNFSAKLIKMYDEILIMDKGILIDHGNYNDLISRNDYFKTLCDIKFDTGEVNNG